MTPKEHAQYLSQRIAEALKVKYMAGDAEHGGRLWRKKTLGHMEEELIDLIVYYYTHKDHTDHIRDLVVRAQNEWEVERKDLFLDQILNLIDVGNVEGVKEEERS